MDHIRSKSIKGNGHVNYIVNCYFFLIVLFDFWGPPHGCLYVYINKNQDITCECNAVNWFVDNHVLSFRPGIFEAREVN